MMIGTMTGIQDGAIIIGTAAGIIREKIMTGKTAGIRAAIGEVGAMIKTGTMDGARIEAGAIMVENGVESGMTGGLSLQPYHRPHLQHFIRLSIQLYHLHIR